MDSASSTTAAPTRRSAVASASSRPPSTTPRYFAVMEDVEHTETQLLHLAVPAAREATVFDGAIDLKFRNPSKTGVMIQAIGTSSNITVRIWGTKTVDVESVTGGRTNQTSPNTITLRPARTACPQRRTRDHHRCDTRIITDANTGAEISRNTRTVRYDRCRSSSACRTSRRRSRESTRAVSPARLPLRAEGPFIRCRRNERSLQLSAGRRRDAHTSIGGGAGASASRRGRAGPRGRWRRGGGEQQTQQTAIEIHSRGVDAPTVS